MRGKLFTEYYVVCALCQEEMPVGAKDRSNAISYLARGGWKNTRQHGYVCKECYQQGQGNVTSVVLPRE
jgi:hypothetical protein